MPKVDSILLGDASFLTVGPIHYFHPMDRAKQAKMREITGITKGQWKRFKYSIKSKAQLGDYGVMRASLTSIRKLEILAKHHDSPHLYTLLKMAEAQTEET